MPDTTAHTLTPDQAPALTHPALAVACPACHAVIGTLCSGTRSRRYDVHRLRTDALASTS